MPNKPKSGSAASPKYAERLEWYERIVRSIPDVERKGATMPYTSVNGNMFSLFTKEGTLALRLSDADRAEFLKKHRTQLTVQYGTEMKEYVDVPDALLADIRTMRRYFAKSYEYAKSLRPKPTTSGKKRVPKRA